MNTLRGDLDSITKILEEAFETEPFKRDYDSTFAKVAKIIGRYGVLENPRTSGSGSYSACKSFLTASRRNSGG